MHSGSVRTINIALGWSKAVIFAGAVVLWTTVVHIAPQTDDVRRIRHPRRTDVPHPHPLPTWGEGIGLGARELRGIRGREEQG